jgi:DNA repair protein NreA
MDSLCISCKGKGLCGRPCKILTKFTENAPKLKLHFSGKSAPELFVGRIGYPYVNSGILAPSENDNISNFATAEEWSRNNFSIENVLRLRGQLIYGRGSSHIKSTNRLKQVTQELALSSKPTSTEFFLKKKPILQFTPSSIFRPMTNPAPIKKVLLEENPKVEKKVDYLTADYDIKSTTALRELYASKIKVDHLQKLLSTGLLGVKLARRMVPTRWSITATDDTISKQLLEKIRYYPEIDEITLLSGNFMGNYIEALLIPGKFSFEAFEAWISGNFYAGEETKVSQDYEGFFGRKTYASNITGGYYAMRLPTAEYLEKIKRQATVLIVREIRPDYYAPLGVGIVRECTRRAFTGQPIKFDTMNDAFRKIQTRLTFTPMGYIRENSWILNHQMKQKSLNDFK